MTDPIMQVVETKRGEMTVINTGVGQGFFTRLGENLPKFGVEWSEANEFELLNMSDGELVEYLNDLRLDDKLLILAIHDYRGVESLFYNIQECFLKQGGRAVIADYSVQRIAA